jgi:thioredoxin-related protein
LHKLFIIIINNFERGKIMNKIFALMIGGLFLALVSLFFYNLYGKAQTEVPDYPIENIAPVEEVNTGSISPVIYEAPTYLEAMRYAGARRGLVFLYFESDNCFHCDRMKPVLADRKVKEAFHQEGVCTIYRDNISRNRILARKFNVTATPTYIVLDQFGRVVKRGLGYKSPNELINWLD